MLSLEKVAAALTTHVSKCRSAQLVCRTPVAVESWFRIELVSALVDVGIALEHVKFNCAYLRTGYIRRAAIECCRIATVISRVLGVSRQV